MNIYKKITLMVISLSFALIMSISAAASAHYTIKPGDTMWKIAVKYKVGLSEIISANPQISNPAMIYPGQTITIPSTDSKATEYENEAIRLVNDIRVSNGLKEFKADWELSRVARYKSQDMKDNNYFSHTSPVYGSPFDMIKSFGLRYKTAGENIAKGQSLPKAVVHAWMNSVGHRKNILNPSFTKIGVGYVEGGNYWTQMFIG